MTQRRTSLVGKLLLPMLLILLRVRIKVKRLIGCSLTSFAWALSVRAVAVAAVVENDHTKMFQAISAAIAVTGVRQHLAAVVVAVADQEGGVEEGGSCDRRQIILRIEFARPDPDHHSIRTFCLHFLFHFILKPQFYKCRSMNSFCNQ